MLTVEIDGKVYDVRDFQAIELSEEYEHEIQLRAPFEVPFWIWMGRNTKVRDVRFVSKEKYSGCTLIHLPSHIAEAIVASVLSLNLIGVNVKLDLNTFFYFQLEMNEEEEAEWREKAKALFTKKLESTMRERAREDAEILRLTKVLLS